MIKRFECNSCHFRKDLDIKTSISKCPECGRKCYRIVYKTKPQKEKDFVNISLNNNERWSTSMGVPAGQVEQFSKRFPNSTYSPDGRLLIKNRADKKRQMKERGFIEHN